MRDQQPENTQYIKNQHIKSFVVRGGRMSKGQQDAYDVLMKDYSLKAGEEVFDFPAIFGNECDVIIEIGFGSGTATAEIAAGQREKNYIGIEVYKPGIGNLLKLIMEKRLLNVRVIEGDAYPVFVKNVPAGSLSGIHLFFPDPWPKKKHHKRRIVRTDFTPVMRDALRPGGYIYFVTDWDNYAEEALRIFSSTPGLQNKYDGFAPAQKWRPVTRFHRKGEEKNHRVYEIFFERPE